MALSGHKTPQAARIYVKRTETQRDSSPQTPRMNRKQPKR